MTKNKKLMQKYLVQLASAGCLPDSSFPAESFGEAIETARSLFDNEFDGSEWLWAWSVDNSLRASDVIDAAPYPVVFASQNGNGLYSVTITAVDDETYEEWLDQ